MAQITDIQDNARKLIDDANDLARRFCRRMGYERPRGYRFDRGTHPQEQMCWAMACDVAEHFFGTDLQEVLDDLEDA